MFTHMLLVKMHQESRTLMLAGETAALADGIDSTVFPATLYSKLTSRDCTHNTLLILCN